MDLKSKLLLCIVFGVIIISISATYYKSVILQDFEIEYEEELEAEELLNEYE